jgi:hypothetical protein
MFVRKKDFQKLLSSLETVVDGKCAGIAELRAQKAEAAAKSWILEQQNAELKAELAQLKQENRLLVERMLEVAGWGQVHAPLPMEEVRAQQVNGLEEVVSSSSNIRDFVQNSELELSRAYAAMKRKSIEEAVKEVTGSRGREAHDA